MCGRYACAIGAWDGWQALFRGSLEEIQPSYNIAPGSMVQVYSRNGWQRMRWGLVPAWSGKDRTPYATHNARAESLTDKPAFRSPWRKGQRCLVPASGYFEWHDGGSGKIPYYIHARNDSPLLFAGLWERWAGDNRDLLSCTIVTCPAQGSILPLHPRMPLVLSMERAAVWLDGSPEANLATLRHPPEAALAFHRVSSGIGSIRNQGEELIQPVHQPHPRPLPGI